MKSLFIIFVLVCVLSVRAQTNLPATATNIAAQTILSPAVSITTAAPQTPAIAPPNNAPAKDDWSKYVALIVSIAALGYTIWKDVKTNKRMEKIEKEQEREKQEAANRRAKASAPYFTPSGKMISKLYEKNDEGELRAWQGDNANVLSSSRKEMPKDAPEKTPVILPLDNSGKGARRIRLSGEIQGVQLKQEPDFGDANGIIFLKYPYSPSEHGKTQKVVLTFETEDGLELTHAYETRHGCYEFHRVDPK